MARAEQNTGGTRRPENKRYAVPRLRGQGQLPLKPARLAALTRRGETVPNPFHVSSRKGVTQGHRRHPPNPAMGKGGLFGDR
jgi:hypothetical protein